MSSTTSKQPNDFSTILSKISEKLDDISEGADLLIDLANELEGAHEDSVADESNKADEAVAECNETKASLDAEWSLDLTNDGTFMVYHGELECPSRIIEELLKQRDDQVVSEFMQ